jgi:DNA-binding NtrC family response regulator
MRALYPVIRARDPRVIIVDDDPALLQALPESLRLRMSEVTVDTADSAAAALDLIAARDYDTIVTDIKMPGMDGLALLAEIRTHRPDTPILMITGHGEHTLAIQALRSGAYDFIQKPIDRDYFVASLRRAIRARELNSQVKDRQVALERCAREMEQIAEKLGREQARVLLVDDDLALLQALPEALRLRMSGVTVDTADSAAAALNRIDAWDYDVIVTDIKMPGMDGLALLAEIRTRRPDTPTLIITGHGEHELVVQALRGGAYDFIQKPIDRDYFVASLRRAIQKRELSCKVREQQLALECHLNELEAIVEERTRDLRETNKVIKSPLKWLMGPSGQMEKVVQQIKQVADSPLTVLVEGETGTGKELVARAIHQLSARREKPFVAVDCGAIPDTLIESELFGYEKGAFTGAHERKAGQFRFAEGGSLFLDEIVNLPLTTQVKLLRALQERQVQPLGSKQPVRVDVRIIAASNAPLEREARAGRFRQDLYYRLNEFGITLPPLRERDDILHLANEFLPEAAMELGRPCRKISEAAAQVLLRYHWPGNVRELRNVIRRAILLATDVIDPEHLSVLPVDPSPSTALRGEPAPAGSSLKEIAEATVADAEALAIRRTLQTTGGNKSEAARLLRTDYKTLYLKMKQYGISAGQFRELRASRP